VSSALPPDTTSDEIQQLVAVLPSALQRRVREIPATETLIEIVMDLGRRPQVHTLNGQIMLDELEVAQEDLDYVVERIGDFGKDNRAGIERTLHRISAIRNRKGRIIGLTLRVGRAIYGTVDIVRDLMDSGQSVLLLGRPGVGKTTLLRETARVLAERKRVVIVDTSNEIAGDGDIPHPAIGRARRMQVETPALQHEVMIEAVENHSPEVIVIDEIGRELEAMAARTIAERGVQLVGTAHGHTLENLLQNPTLSDLVGGVESVTLSDEEARRRGTQKTVLERRAPATFDILIEIQDFQRLAVHGDVAAAVDALLRGRPLSPEIRIMDADGRIRIEKGTEPEPRRGGTDGHRRRKGPESDEAPRQGEPAGPVPLRRRKVMPYGVSQNRLRQSAKALGVPLIITDDLTESDAVITLKSYYRKRPAAITDAESRRIPIYVLRSNTFTQVEYALADLFGISARHEIPAEASREVEEAIREILTGARDMVELGPQDAAVRRWQHDMARQADLLSASRGEEPQRRVRIYRNNAA
jgi:stage III sporulation protein SpoIIIAA